MLIPPDPPTDVQRYDARLDKLIVAVALVTLDQVNVLRVKAGLAQISAQQMRDAVAAKIATL